VLDIYAASEPPIPGITGERLAQAIQSSGKRDSARYVRSFDEAARRVAQEAKPGDMVLTLGAGSVSQLGPMVLEQLQKKRPAIGTQQSA
jgi:UDP-N-acetylmuramate--alanine ligase